MHTVHAWCVAIDHVMHGDSLVILYIWSPLAMYPSLLCLYLHIYSDSQQPIASYICLLLCPVSVVYLSMAYTCSSIYFLALYRHMTPHADS